RAAARRQAGRGRGGVHLRPAGATVDGPPWRPAGARFHPPARRRLNAARATLHPLRPPTNREAPPMRGNIAQLMQQAQKMQETMQRAQEELASLEVTGKAGGGMVEVTLTGRMDCRKVRIDPSVLSDPEMAEDLVAAAFNDAVNKANAASQEKMGAATAG